ncbi:MAG: hypothetical protein ACXW2U_04000 [Telluria sp.]
MQKLISELRRLYLPAEEFAPEALPQHILGQTTLATNLTTHDGMTRAVVIAFNKMDKGGDAQHWTRLCEVANALQTELNLPAPAVSISAASGYGLWLSLEAPVSAAQAQEFVDLLHRAYFPEMDRPADVSAPVELPPCLNQATGKWAAFIHPGMGASFADESGLEMAPPLAGQAAFLEGLQSISEKQFLHALDMLREAHGAATPLASAPEPDRSVDTGGLLLKDATLEDIVRFLHSKNIEPTFRHLIR